MKKKIYVILTIIISLFMFSGRVEAYATYMKCNLSCDGVCNWSLTSKATANEFAVITDDKGDIKIMALEEGAGGLYGWFFENDGNGSGCWSDNGRRGIADRLCYGDLHPSYILTKEICPKCLCVEPITELDFTWTGVFDRINSQELVPAQQGDTAVEITRINKTVYVVYEYVDADGTPRKIIEGFLGEDMGDKAGAFAFSGPALNAFMYYDGVMHHLFNQIEKYGADYYKVHTDHDKRLIFADLEALDSKGTTQNVCKGYSASQCEHNKKYKVLYDSDDSNGELRNIVTNWYEQNIDDIDSKNGIISLLSNETLRNTCTDINSTAQLGKAYKFNQQYNVESFINDLELAYNSISTVYVEGGIKYKDYAAKDARVELDASLLSKFLNDVFSKSKLSEISFWEKDGKKYSVNAGYLQDALKYDLVQILKVLIYDDDVPKINVENIEDELPKYTKLFYTTTAYMDAYNYLFDLDEDLVKRIKILRTNFEKLVNEQELDNNIIVDCEGLLSQELIDKINDYLDIIKIIVPIILVGYGIIDYTKAIFGGEEEMKKAQTAFLKRIGISIVIFLTPMMVNLILSLANRVWPIISPSSCGLFE